MRVRRLLGTAAGLVLAVSAAAGAQAGGHHAPARDPIDFPDTDVLVGGCLELTPHAVAVTDKTVRLDVRVVLDGASRTEATAAVAGMRRAYNPLGIQVDAELDVAELHGRDAAGLLAQAKDLYGGKRPAGADVVYVMTDKDIVDGAATGGNLVGLADCIGGIRYPRHAFAVGEVGAVSAPGMAQATARTMGHEIGHLLGAQHHYAGPEGLLGGDVTTPLTLMGPTIEMVALRFSTLEGLVVRGHAQKYA